MRTKFGINCFLCSEHGSPPEVANASASARNCQSTPVKVQICRLVSDVKNRQIAITTSGNVRHPNANILIRKLFVAIGTKLVDCQDFFIRNQRRGGGIVAREIATENQRRPKYAP